MGKWLAGTQHYRSFVPFVPFAEWDDGVFSVLQNGNGLWLEMFGLVLVDEEWVLFKWQFLATTGLPIGCSPSHPFRNFVHILISMV